MNILKNKIVVVASGAAVVAAGIATAVALQGNGYRSIVVEQSTGQVLVTGEKNNGNAYEGEKLYSGDAVSVGDASELVMCMDADKYVYADAGTNFGIEASSEKEDSRLKLYLTSGSELNVLKSKLGPNESYEVDTPNSTMSVRGTTFRMTVLEDNGDTYTLLEVEKGEVAAQTKNEDGSYSGKEGSFKAGKAALIKGSVGFIPGEEGKIELEFDYDLLPEDAQERLEEIIGCIEDDVVVGDIEAQEPEEPKKEEPVEDEVEVEEDATAVEESDSETEIDTNTNTANENHVHTPGDWVVTKEATCKATGLRQKVCSECKKTVAAEEIPVSDHVPGEWTIYTQPGCEMEGAESRNCVYCSKVMETRSIPAYGHNYSGGACSECGSPDPSYIVADDEPEPPIPVCSHNWEYVGEDPNNPGYAIWRCTICQETKLVALQ